MQLNSSPLIFLSTTSSILLFQSILVYCLFPFLLLKKDVWGGENWKPSQTSNFYVLAWSQMNKDFLLSLFILAGTWRNHPAGWAQCFAKLSQEWVQWKVGPSQNSGYEHFPSLQGSWDFDIGAGSFLSGLEALNLIRVQSQGLLSLVRFLGWATSSPGTADPERHNSQEVFKGMKSSPGLTQRLLAALGCHWGWGWDCADSLRDQLPVFLLRCRKSGLCCFSWILRAHGKHNFQPTSPVKS